MSDEIEGGTRRRNQPGQVPAGAWGGATGFDALAGNLFRAFMDLALRPLKPPLPHSLRSRVEGAVEMRRQIFTTPWDHKLVWEHRRFTPTGSYASSLYRTPDGNEDYLPQLLEGNDRVSLTPVIVLADGLRNALKRGEQVQSTINGGNPPTPAPELMTMMHEQMHVVMDFLETLPGWRNQVLAELAAAGMPFPMDDEATRRDTATKHCSRYAAKKADTYHEAFAEALTEYAFSKVFGYQARPFAEIIGNAASKVCGTEVVAQNASAQRLQSVGTEELLIKGLSGEMVKRMERGEGVLPESTRTLVNELMATEPVLPAPSLGPAARLALLGEPLSLPAGWRPEAETANLHPYLADDTTVYARRWVFGGLPIDVRLQRDWAPEVWLDKSESLPESFGIRQLSLPNGIDPQDPEAATFHEKLNRRLRVDWFSSPEDARRFATTYAAVLPLANDFVALGGMRHLMADNAKQARPTKLGSIKKLATAAGLGNEAHLQEAYVLAISVAAGLIAKERGQKSPSPLSEFVMQELDTWMNAGDEHARARVNRLHQEAPGFGNADAPIEFPSVAINLVSQFHSGKLPKGWKYADDIRPTASAGVDIRREAQTAGVVLPESPGATATLPGT